MDRCIHDTYRLTVEVTWIESEESKDTSKEPYIDDNGDRKQAQPRIDGAIEGVELVEGKERCAGERLCREGGEAPMGV